MKIVYNNCKAASVFEKEKNYKRIMISKQLQIFKNQIGFFKMKFRSIF